ncbi:MAG: lamin tail domain-containing protein [Bacteroidota bacterium]
MRLLLIMFLCLANFTAIGQLYINEASNSNGAIVNLSDGSSPDWLEIYNGGSESIDLGSYWLSDDSDELAKWKFPHVLIEPGEFRLVLANGSSDTTVVDHFETAVFANDSWQYTIPSSELPSDWKTNPLASVTWSTGPLGIGYGDGDDLTVTAPSNSIFVRKIFNITDKTVLVSALLDIDYDDGFVAYLNGTEIARSGLAGNPPAWDEPSSDHEAQLYQGGALSTFAIDDLLLSQLLVDGDNILAIQVHNTNPGSSDLSLIPYLSFGVTQSADAFSGTVHPYFVPLSFSAYYSTSFSIATSGETIYLSDPNGIIADSLQVPDLEPDMSVGKLSDGGVQQFYFLNPTPGATNETSNGFAAVEPVPTITTEGGFFENSIEVSVVNNSQYGGIVRYTLDAQTPTELSPIYSGPITIGVDAVLTVACFPTQPDILRSSVNAESYLVLEDYTIPVISIITDPDNLYGALGIFDNYNTDWKRPCQIEYFDKEGVKRFESRASIKPDGGAGGSRSHPQHSVTIEPANSLYGQGEPIQYPLIPEKSGIGEFYAFYLRNGSNYWNAYPQKDATFMRIMRTTNVNSQSYTPVVAYVNGEYFGVYELREKANEGYFENNYGNDRDSLDLLSVSYFYGAGILRTVKGSDSGFYNMRNFITSYDPINPDFFEKSHDLLDLYNFADYIAAENWFANYDWVYNNMKIARTRTKGNRWRFFLQDMELGLGGWSDYNANLFDYFRFNNQPNPYWDIYNGLVQNTKFKNYFVNRYADLMNSVMKINETAPIVNEMYEELLPELPKHFQLWTGDVTAGMATYSAVKDGLLDQLANRSGVVREQIVTEFGLNESVIVNLDVQPPGAGYIKISTIVPENLPWSGVYFDGVPVKITAVANPGYQFVSWQSNLTIPMTLLDTNSVELNIADDDTFIALFDGTSEPLAIRVSEVNYHPEESINGGDWAEVRNDGTTPLDLTGWKIGSKEFFERYSVPDNTVIPPGGFMVIAQDKALFQDQYPNVLNVVGSTEFGWDNRSDTIRLFDPFGNEVLQINYTDSLPFPECADGLGRTMEGGQQQNDWFCGCIGGSPGKAYELCNELLPVSEINHNNVIQLSNAGDWFELTNKGNSPIQLGGYSVRDSRDNNLYVLPQVTIEAGEFVVVCNDETLFAQRHPEVTNVVGAFDFGLAANDVIRIYDPNGKIVSSVVYRNYSGWPQLASIADNTMEYSWFGQYSDPNDPDSWFDGCEGGSPGRAFETCPVLPNEEELYIYPNPAESEINIVFGNDLNSSKRTTIFVYDASGRVIHVKEIDAVESVVGYQLNIFDYGHGVYYVRMIQSDFTVTKPFVKL